MIIPSPIALARIRRAEYLRDYGRAPNTIKMHPRVWISVAEECAHCEVWLNEGTVELLGMSVVEDVHCPGIEMFCSE